MSTNKRTNRSTNPTEIAANTRVDGRVAGAEDLLVLGRVTGRIEIEGTVEVAAGGIVEADIEATRLVVSGVVVGNVTVTEALIIESTGRVVGELTSPTLKIAQGAQYAGTLAIGGTGAAKNTTVEDDVDTDEAPSVDLPPPVEVDFTRRDRDFERPGTKRVVVKKRA